VLTNHGQYFGLKLRLTHHNTQIAGSAGNPNKLIDVENHVALEWPTYRPKIGWRTSNTARNVRRTVELKE
jgi:hypothetical protein